VANARAAPVRTGRRTDLLAADSILDKTLTVGRESERESRSRKSEPRVGQTEDST
jgi:hypothetical protein